MMCSSPFILHWTVLLTVCQAYIVPIDKTHDCISISCENGGNMDYSTCICSCPEGNTGFSCETELSYSDWPEGVYSLPMSMFGCPEEAHKGWSKGYINMTTPLSATWHIWNDDDLSTLEPNILGPYYKHSLQLNFCVKNNTLEKGKSEAKEWEPGNYCILMTGGNCPKDFQEGEILMTGYHYESNDLGGVLPDLGLSNTSNVRLYFCCREDGDVKTAITLPDTFPFNLFLGPSSTTCQTVDNMVVQKDMFYMVDAYHTWQFQGAYPSTGVNVTYEDRVGIPFCYYVPYERRECYFTDDKGVSYNGRVNTTESGKPCVFWSTTTSYYKNTREWYGEFQENYCRNWGEYGRTATHPVCIIDAKRTKERCNVSVCDDNDLDMRIFGKNKPYYNIAGENPQYAVDGYIIWFPVTLRYIGTYVSKLQWDFLNYGAFRCDDIRFPRKAREFRFQCKRPIVGQYVSFRNFDSTDPVSNEGKFFYLSLEEVKIYGKVTNCGRPLGMISGNIYSYQIESSSVLVEGDNHFISYHARVLNPGIGWCSMDTDTQPWILIDLIAPTRIQGILLQGWNEGQVYKFIRKFTLSFGVRRAELREYEDPIGSVKVFRVDESMAASSVQRFMLTNDVLARFVQINPIVDSGKSACLKLEVIGCQKQAKRDLFCKQDSVIDFGFEELDRVAWWLEEEDLLPPWYTHNVSDTKICRDICLETNCVSFSHNKHDQTCLMHAGHRYDPEHVGPWVQNVAEVTVAGHRLCFKEITAIDDCNNDVQVFGNGTITVTSPGAPLMYEQGLNCTWNFFADDGMYVKLEMIYVKLAKTASLADIKEIGVYDVNPGNCQDELRIYNPDDGQETVIRNDNEERFIDTVFISSTNRLSLNLKTCFQYSRQGQNYFAVNVSTADFPGCEMVGDGCIAKCTAEEGYISSNRYPSKYVEGDSCLWTIEGQFGQFVELDIISLDVPDTDDSCAKSFLVVYDRNIREEEQELGRFCKNERPYHVIRSSWQTMAVEFWGGAGLRGRGFLGKYKIRSYTQNFGNTSNPECDDGWNFYNGHCYSLFNSNSTSDEGVTWVEAEERCTAYDAHLVSITTKQEMEFIHYSLTSLWNRQGNSEFYIGLRKNFLGGDIDSFSWTDGSPLTFTAWYKDTMTGIAQPDGLANERCTTINLYSIHVMDDWNDIACAFDKIRSYICEKKLTSNTKRMRNQFESLGLISKSRNNTYFKCNNTQLISLVFVCDGLDDCGDHSDERDCESGCSPNQFECKDGTCISLSLYCDLIPQCPDSSDENSCERPPCLEGEWRCTSGQCLPGYQRCDLKPDCYDKTDEMDCKTCEGDSFQCYDQKCIPRSLVCDGYVDCSGRLSEDENQNCQNYIHRSCAEWWSLGKRENGEYLVNFGVRDEPPSKVECEFLNMNGSIRIKTYAHHGMEEIVDTKLSGIDENINYIASDIHISVLKHESTCKQRIRLRCHRIHFEHKFFWYADNGKEFSTFDVDKNCSCTLTNSCEPGKTRCNCNTELNTWRVLDNDAELEDSGVITDELYLPVRRVYTKHSQSPFRWFEFQLGPLECVEDISLRSPGFLCRSGVTVAMEMKCLLDYDEYEEVRGCRDLSHLDNCDSFVCPSGFVKCRDSYCIPIRMMCDGEDNCADGEDEAECENVTCPGLFKCKGSSICLEPREICDGVKNCQNNDDEYLCSFECPSSCLCEELSVTCPTFERLNITSIPGNTRKLDSSNSNFSSSLPALDGFRLLAELNLSYCGIKQITPYYFQTLKNLYSLDLGYNNLTYLLPGTFEGLKNLIYLNLQGNFEISRIEPYAFNGLSKLEKLEIRYTQIQYIYSDAFHGLLNVKKLDIRQNEIRSVEDNAFSWLKSLDELDMRGNKIEDFSKGIFNGLISLKKLETDAYVFCCLKPTDLPSDGCFPQADEFSSCSDLMRRDVLRWFLWIIGVCALLGNLGVILYRFVFDKQTLRKGHGVLIANLGVSDFCMGIYLLIIASADTHFRGKYIWNDINWRKGELCQFAGLMSTVASECSVVFLCLITLDRIIAVKFPFGQYRMTQKRALVAGFTTWLIMLIIATVPLLPTSYFNGEFYSRSAVCLALPLTRDKPAGWEYGTGVFIIFNFIVFVVIAVGQLIIYKEVSIAVDARIRSQRRNQDMAIARSLFLVVITDFICWFPIGVMGLLALSGRVISGEVYAWTAVFILPVNSALNPFLYTFSAILKERKEGGSLMLSRKRQRTSTTTVSTVDDAWSDIIKSEMFVLGNRQEKYYTLADHLRQNKISIPDMTSIVKNTTYALSFLHERGMIHGSLQEDNIVLTVKGKVIDNVSTRVSPRIADAENDLSEDMFALGQLVRKLLREHQGKLVVTKSMP